MSIVYLSLEVQSRRNNARFILGNQRWENDGAANSRVEFARINKNSPAQLCPLNRAVNRDTRFAGFCSEFVGDSVLFIVIVNCHCFPSILRIRNSI